MEEKERGRRRESEKEPFEKSSNVRGVVSGLNNRQEDKRPKTPFCIVVDKHSMYCCFYFVSRQKSVKKKRK